MNKDEARSSVMGAISMVLKDTTLQQGFEIICKNLLELEEENAELKKQRFSLRNERNTFLTQNEQYEKDLINSNENLTKAIEILKKYHDECPAKYSFEDIDDMAEQFLKEFEK